MSSLQLSELRFNLDCLNEIQNKSNRRTCEDCKTEIETKPNVRLCADCRKERQLQRARNYKKQNKQAISNYNKQYKQINKEDIAKYNHNYNISHRAQIQARQNIQHAERRKTDVNFRLQTNYRNKMHKLFDAGASREQRTQEYLGCSWEFFSEWMRFQYALDMTDENYGQHWHVDHVVPISKFNLTEDIEMKKCSHWTNLQPKRGVENMSKNNRTCIMEQVMQELKVHVFLKTYTNDDFTIIEFDRTKYLN